MHSYTWDFFSPFGVPLKSVLFVTIIQAFFDSFMVAGVVAHLQQKC